MDTSTNPAVLNNHWRDLDSWTTRNVEPARQFDAWRAEQPEFVSVSLYRFRPLKGQVLVAVAPELVRRLVDAYYGGLGVHGERVVKEFTPTEERLLTRLSEALVETLTEVWSEVVPVKRQMMSWATSRC